ncbi:HAD-like protein [Corynespora cassiicola Philippines]|uniref:HAD-like protein n=1 Tax=Corynespora cassiicola Philippines TaxID=1448308 RepID=A0A2T2N128_CORCC|nr:HAD-like protein [Corynespora cassiicola Philippines]
MSDNTPDGHRSTGLFFDGFLVDLDGTIVDTTVAVEKHWHDVGSAIGIDAAVILQTSHGRRSIDTLKLVAPEKATWQYVQEIEAAIPKNHGDLATLIRGAGHFLASLESDRTPWAIVTSGSLPLLQSWSKKFLFPLPGPNRLITAESVQLGKPDPTCYHLGRKSLDLDDAAELLVIEDSPAGVRAGKDAGCKVLALLTSHTYEQISAEKPHWIVKDLESVKIDRKEGGRTKVVLSNIL